MLLECSDVYPQTPQLLHRVGNRETQLPTMCQRLGQLKLLSSQDVVQAATWINLWASTNPRTVTLKIGISLLHNAGMEVLKKMQTNIHLQEHLQILLGQHFIFIGQGKFVGGPTNFFGPTNAYKFHRSESHQPLGIQSLHKPQILFSTSVMSAKTIFQFSQIRVTSSK